MSENTPEAVASNDELGLMAQLKSLKVLLGTDSPEVRGWSPAVRQSAEATVNTAIRLLKEKAIASAPEMMNVKGLTDSERLIEARRLVVEHRRASISLVQRYMRIGYSAAALLLEDLEKEGTVSPMDASGVRKVLKA